MKTRILLSLVVLLTVGVLVGCNQLPTTMVPPAPAEQAVEGQEVAGGAFRLWRAPQKRPADLAYQIENGRVYEGQSVSPSNIVFSFSNDRIFAGANASTDIQYFFENGRMWEGANVNGAPDYTIEDNGRVYAGSSSQGTPIYTIDGDRFYSGPRVSPTNIVFQASGPINGNLRFVVLALALAEQ